MSRNISIRKNFRNRKTQANKSRSQFIESHQDRYRPCIKKIIFSHKEIQIELRTVREKQDELNRVINTLMKRDNELRIELETTKRDSESENKNLLNEFKTFKDITQLEIKELKNCYRDIVNSDPKFAELQPKVEKSEAKSVPIVAESCAAGSNKKENKKLRINKKNQPKSIDSIVPENATVAGSSAAGSSEKENEKLIKNKRKNQPMSIEAIHCMKLTKTKNSTELQPMNVPKKPILAESSSPKNELQQEESPDSVNKFEKIICGEEFRNESERNTHHDNNHEICKICKREFGNKSEFEAHQKKDHEICNICNRPFGNESELKAHQEKDHEICKICDRPFGNELELKAHQKKDHKTCNICDRPFRNESELKVHQEKDHGICKICEGQFGIESEFEAHRKEFHTKKSK